MLFALLAKVLLKRPPWVQAVVLGLCTGLFVSAAAEANDRDPAISTTLWLVLVWGAVAGALFYAGFVYQQRRGGAPVTTAPGWWYAVYVVVWVFGLLAALLALLGEGGFKVAALAIVPLVLLAPTAVQGIRLALGRARA
jgi:heme/copper-type cytochrome/quinol oxidase subunit 2